MLVNFTLDNWMSFRDRTRFSMTASNERQHAQRLACVSAYQPKILPIAVIFGGNAVGKTNFFKALNFARHLVVKGTLPNGLIRTEPFLLNDGDPTPASRFVFTLLLDENFYEYSFTVTSEKVLFEKLTRQLRTTEKILFSRQGRNCSFDRSLSKYAALQFAFKGTRDNQLFLHNSVAQQLPFFQPIYAWFQDSLQLVAPDSRFAPFSRFLDDADPMYPTLNALLPRLDTGLSRVGSVPTPMEMSTLPDAIRSRLQQELREGETVRLARWSSCGNLLISRQNGKLLARKLVIYHRKNDGSEAAFELDQESDGVSTLLSVVPIFLELSRPDTRKVYAIDSIGRGLHPLLTHDLLKSYLSLCTEKKRGQLILSSHDAMLIDQSLLRRDEMWVADRDSAGVSFLHNLSESKNIRNDNNLRKAYFEGRFGGIPITSLHGVKKRSKKEH